MILKSHLKDSSEQLDYSIDYSATLISGETIVTSVWEIAPAGSLVVVAELNSTTGTTIWVNAGTANTKYTLVNRITTNSTPARIIERAITITIKNN